MKLSGALNTWLLTRAFRVMRDRDPDFSIGDTLRPYLHRWWLVPRNPLFNVYLHMICRDDDDRALHDHPWINVSVVLFGAYREALFNEPKFRPHGGTRTVVRSAGDVIARMPRTAHRLEVQSGPVITLFITGPRLRAWGFWCADGWRHWRAFTDPGNTGQVGRGCA